MKTQELEFGKSLVKELAFKTKWEEESKKPKLQKKELNPRIFNTKAKF